MYLDRVFFSRSVALLMVSLFAAFAAPGQSLTQLHGKVVDQSGGYVPNATVTLFSDDRVRTALTDGSGAFSFLGLSAPGRFLEASARGFKIAGVLLWDKSPDEVVVTLSIGSCSQCGFMVDTRDRSTHYEERTSAEQLIGSVWGYKDSPLSQTSLVLMKADLTTAQPTVSSTSPNAPLSERNFRYRFATQMISDEQGNFHFSGLEPGWYSMEVSQAGYRRETREFWIARDTVTRPSRIEMLRPNGASPLGYGEIAPRIEITK